MAGLRLHCEAGDKRTSTALELAEYDKIGIKDDHKFSDLKYWVNGGVLYEDEKHKRNLEGKTEGGIKIQNKE